MLAVCRNTNLECEKVEGTEDGGSERERDETTGLKRGQHADSVCVPAACIKKNKSAGVSQTKFKVRCQKSLYTLVLKDTDKADKLKQSLPPGM